MPPSVDDRLLDIRNTIIEIEELLSTKTREDFLTERGTRLMTERLLEIVCEATRHLPQSLKEQETRIVWRDITDFGNLLRHAYHSTQADIVWEVAKHDLPVLKQFAESMIKLR